jgi:hypothetical protein
MLPHITQYCQGWQTYCLYKQRRCGNPAEQLIEAVTSVTLQNHGQN